MPEAMEELRSLIEKVDTLNSGGSMVDLIEEMVVDLATRAALAQVDMFATMEAEQKQGRDVRSSVLLVEAAATSATWEQVLLVVLKNMFPPGAPGDVLRETMRLKNLLVAHCLETIR